MFSFHLLLQADPLVGLNQIFGQTFKDNQFVEKTVLSGVSQIAKESIFIGANNFDVYSVLDDEFAKDFEIEEDLKDVKRWYDGNKIGNIEGIYNPWSILKYLKDKKIMNQMYGD